MGTPQEETMNRTIRFAGLAMMLVMVVMGFTQTRAEGQVRLSVRQSKLINGFEAQLRGDYRENNGVPERLNAQLERINIPAGTPVAFCVFSNGVNTLIGVGKVATVGGIPTASV